MYSLESVKRFLEKNRGNKKVVLIGGSFDILHVYHLKILTEAKKLGDILIVGINSDKHIRKKKVKGRPIVPEKCRAEMVNALKPVDLVFITDISLYYPENISAIKPDVFVFGKDKKRIAARHNRVEWLKKEFPNMKVAFKGPLKFKISTSKIVQKCSEKLKGG